MRNKKKTDNRDFWQFRARLFTRIAVMMLGAVGGIYLLYTYVLHGNFANRVVTFLHRQFHIEYADANRIYRYAIRNHIEFIFAVSIVVIFLVLCRIYLNRFTKYFLEINSGMEVLLQEHAEDISLPAELSAIEKKMNTVKHTLEKRKLDMELAERRKRDLVMYLAHDLKTPLASVIGYLNLLHDEGEISGQLREKYLSISLDKAERLETLINEFFEMARFNFSDMVLQYGRINLTRLLEQLVYEFHPMLQEKNLECKLEAPQDLMIRCDADKLQRVFDNLLRNAVLYSYEKTGIEVMAMEQDRNAVVRFVNHGDTIPEEKLAHIFEQFYRLDAARSTKSGGAGLGLAIAKEIVEAHGGTIAAESRREQSIFTVTLPLDTE